MTARAPSHAAQIYLSELEEPFVIAHRGGALVFPENTLQAYLCCTDLGLRAIEPDCWKLKDGALAVMHDSTLTRTTSTTGNTADHNSASWRKLSVDGSSFLASGYADEAPPLLEDVFSKMGPAVVFPEAKNTGSGAKILEHLQRHQLERSAVVQAFYDTGLVASELPVIQAAGIPTMAVLTDNSVPAATLAATGVEYAACNSDNLTSLYASQLLAVGIKPGIYTINRRSEWETFQGYGCVFCFSDDPLYLASSTPITTSAPWAVNTWPHGMVPDDLGADRGTITGGKWVQGNIGNLWVLQGYACPQTAGTYTISVSVKVDTLSGDGTRFLGLIVCSPDDATADGGGIGKGYLVGLRENGTLQVWRRDPAATSLGTQATAALVAGDTMTLTVAVTPTQVVATRTDVAAPNNVVCNDTAYRGDYFHCGKQDNDTGSGLLLTWNSVAAA